MLLREAQEARCPVYQVEKRENGISHAEIGAYLLGLWGIPYSMVEAVALHHGPNRVPHQNFDAISAVDVANLLTHSWRSPPAGNRQSTTWRTTKRS